MKMGFAGFVPDYRPGIDTLASARPVSRSSDARRVYRTALDLGRPETRLFHAWRP